MKLYQIVMEVPDDFVPEEMELTASFDGDVNICCEGFLSCKCFTAKSDEVDLDSIVDVDSESAVVVEDTTASDGSQLEKIDDECAADDK